MHRSSSDRQEGRRARKKRESRAAIVAAATRLFDKRGFSVTTMDEVAAEADVAVGTLYNYFKSKDRLLLGVFEDATEKLLDDGKAVLDKPGDDPEKAIFRLLATYEPLATIFDKTVMREMLAAAMLRPTEEVEGFANLDVRLAESVGQLLATLAGRGLLSPELDFEAAGIALYGALMVPVLLFLSVGAMDRAALREMVRRQVRTIVTGILPNEPAARADKSRARRPRKSSARRRKAS